MKKVFFVFILFAMTLTACPQKADQTFDAPVLFKKSATFLDTLFLKDGTFLLTAPIGGSPGIVQWNDILSKPTLFPPETDDLDLKYLPMGYVPTWEQVTGKPSEIALNEALSELEYLPIPQKTTAQINATQVPFGVVGIIWDNDLGVLKLWDGMAWKIIITNQ